MDDALKTSDPATARTAAIREATFALIAEAEDATARRPRARRLAAVSGVVGAILVGTGVAHAAGVTGFSFSTAPEPKPTPCVRADQMQTLATKMSQSQQHLARQMALVQKALRRPPATSTSRLGGLDSKIAAESARIRAAQALAEVRLAAAQAQASASTRLPTCASK